MTRNLMKSFAFILAGVLVGCTTAAPPTPRMSMSEVLAGNDYALGAEVEQVDNFRLDRWDPIDGKHIIVFDAAAQAYLLTFTETCYGVDGNRLILLAQRHGSLTLNDRIEVKHEGRTADYCYVETINRLEAAG